MIFYQSRFFAYPSGAPFLHTLNSASAPSYTLVTTDRSVSLLTYGEAGYRLHKLKMNVPQSEEPHLVASAAMELSTTHEARIAVAYAIGEAYYLQVFVPPYEHLDHAGAVEASSGANFELDAAPTCMFDMQAVGTNGNVFYGVIVCCADAMLAIGYIVNGNNENPSIDADTSWTRLRTDQFAAFFPEFATFAHTVVAVDRVMSPEKDQGWVALGCTDGLVRVFHGQHHGGLLTGPFRTKDLQLNGVVTSVALYVKRAASEDAKRTWRCNLLVTCAIGQALVYEDLFGPVNHIGNGEVLVGSDHFDSIFTGVVADVDLDGHVELVLGTDAQVVLAYKERREDESQPTSILEDATRAVLDPVPESVAASANEISPLSTGSARNIWEDLETIAAIDERVARAPEPSLARWKWQRLSKRQWNVQAFGAIYSLLWRDINHDGVPEFLVASATGVYVYEADAVVVLKKIESVLSALTTSRT
ncbi:hypothetical protein PsorP6_018251 [Peronosclerospora sorghi]|uniref:Uncharacterized protein n=1 Tax=Peronosclerospora sorghi TaxID=230839 RepID=A0ACC0WDL9_9STRA|nr:hypothetical protein PsorP6_018251 [Peronosclerospora sorghi]